MIEDTNQFYLMGLVPLSRSLPMAPWPALRANLLNEIGIDIIRKARVFGLAE